ncbi:MULTISPECIES: hypothetical protein [Bacillus]|uniref:hypothetical protein n=1 Tax=Bacillus TaxID=1386 RepID=UPI0009935583|nr:hypothetical protein [Bacillus mycoides]OOR62251.1 hypothetical protein BLX04_15015 [Bacillus mycoides]
MKTFSMFEFPGVQNIEAAQGLIGNNRYMENNINWNDRPLSSSITEIPNFNLANPEVIEFSGREVKYLFFNCSTERARKEEYWYGFEGLLKPREERVNQYQAEVLLFEYNNEVKCIVFKGVTLAKTILTDCLPIDRWGERDVAQLPVTEDLLYWIFKRYIDLRQSPLSPQHNMYVTALKSYAGKTRDNVNAMRGMGNRISTILGTLAFLFNNENLKAVRPQLQYEGEVMLIEVSLTGTCRIWEEEYQGRWLMHGGNRLTNILAMYCFVVIIPNLIDSYRENIARGVWSPQLKVEFLQSLGNEIKDQVDAELNRLQIEIIEDNDELQEEEYLDIFDVSEEDDMEG